ncbi:MAG TPA: 23S rRNA (uracil(1939)-C(5))-methyltransferase RlmD [Gammaproteobacteria bacterium]|nr:23S rRNA (uracil(1939)-C(5))-methyltransferase RlmD [Gammaproteobacteria bacterium]
MTNLNKTPEATEAPSAKVHAFSHDGRGIATINHITTFIAGALKGETVTYRITQKRSSHHEAVMTEVQTPSPQRTTPPCSHFGVCGGCSLQHMHPSMQVELKQQTLLDQLKHFGKVTPESILPALETAALGYRRKARLGVKFVIKKDKMLVGFREKAGRYLADLNSCPVLYPAVGEKLTALAALVRALEQYQSIPQIEVAVGDETVALVFRHLTPLPEADLAKLTAFGEEHQFHIYLQPNPPAAVHRLFPEGDDQRLHYTLPDFGLSYAFHPLDFTQVNLEMNRLMVKQAITLLEPKANERVLDLFCGIGNFTLPLAKHAAHVTGVEGGQAMVERGFENAALNGISNVAFYAANLMAETQTGEWAKQAYDKVLLDPPRAGAKEILPLLGQIQAKRIVYVSCNPATLARDAGELVHLYGYCLKSVGIMNMFPHTAHIEAMAVFERSEKHGELS